jgi:hypothetical protein
MFLNRLFLIGFVISSVSAVYETEWKVYKSKYKKNYSDFDDAAHFENFLENIKLVADHNLLADLGLKSFRLKANQFADSSFSEYNAINMRLPESRNASKTHRPLEDPPLAFDWRDRGIVGPVWDQGATNISSVYAAVGGVEAQYAKKMNLFMPLSPQQLIDCSNPQPSDSPQQVYANIMAMPGLESIYGYPSEPAKGPCAYDPSKVKANLSGFSSSLAGNEDELLSRLYNDGPYTVMIDGRDPVFALYVNGVYTTANCATDEPNHSLLLVGYGVDDLSGLPFWTFKNSWGAKYGENGYIRIVRGKNMCGIAQHPSVPILAD